MSMTKKWDGAWKDMVFVHQEEMWKLCPFQQTLCYCPGHLWHLTRYGHEEAIQYDPNGWLWKQKRPFLLNIVTFFSSNKNYHKMTLDISIAILKINWPVPLWSMQIWGCLVSTKSITQVQIFPFLGIPRFHFPLNGYFLLSIWWPLHRCTTDGEQQMAGWCQNIRWITSICVLFSLRCAWMQHHKFNIYLLRITVPFSLGISQVITHSHSAKSMANYQNFKSTTILKERPLVENAKSVKISAIPRGIGTN